MQRQSSHSANIAERVWASVAALPVRPESGFWSGGFSKVGGPPGVGALSVCGGISPILRAYRYDLTARYQRSKRRIRGGVGQRRVAAVMVGDGSSMCGGS